MVVYRKSSECDIDEVERLYRIHLDSGKRLHGRLAAVYRNPDTISCIAVDEETGKIVGLAIYTKGISLSCGHLEICREIREFTHGMEIYTGESLLVEKEYRNHNIARELNRHIVSQLKEISAEINKEIFVLHEMWVYPDGKIPAYNVVKDIYGIYHDFGIVPHFYKDYYKDGYLCPICGENCICSAKITVSKITD